MKNKFTTPLLIFACFALIVASSCGKKTPAKQLIYPENEDFFLIDDISKGLGYDSMLIAKGDYPISFDKNQYGQLTLKVLRTVGKGSGNAISTFSKPLFGRRRGDFNCNGNVCICWGFSCKEGGKGRLISYAFTLSGDQLLIDILEKVPFGEEGYELTK